MARHADCSNLQDVGINTYVQLAPLTAVFSTVLFALPLAFTQNPVRGSIARFIGMTHAASLRPAAQLFMPQRPVDLQSAPRFKHKHLNRLGRQVSQKLLISACVDGKSL